MGGGGTLGGGAVNDAGLGLIPPPPTGGGLGGRTGLGVVGLVTSGMGDSGDDTDDEEFDEVAAVGVSMDRKGFVAKLPGTIECNLPAGTFACNVVGGGGLTV